MENRDYYERALITKLLTMGEGEESEEIERIKPEFIADRDVRIYFELINKHHTTYKVMPDRDILKTQHELLPSSGKSRQSLDEVLLEQLPCQPLKWFVDELITEHVTYEIAEDIAKANDFLTGREPYKAVDEIRKLVSKADSSFVESSHTSLAEGRDERDKEFRRRISGETLLGIPTGIPPIDCLTGGIGEGELWTILGFTNIGKSWMLGIMACNAFRAGYKPLIITREMTPSELQQRIDAMYLGISYGRFTKGTSTPNEIKKWDAFLKEAIPTGKDLYIEESTGGVSNIASLMNKRKPDLVLTDGAYLLVDDSSNEGMWQKINQVWIDMKNLCLATKVPNIATMQLKENAAMSKNISSSKSIGQHCDSMWGLQQSEDQKQDKMVQVVSMKQRKAPNVGSFVMDWDFTEMSTDVVSVYGIPGYDEYMLKRSARKIGESKTGSEDMEVEERPEEEKPKLKSKLGLRRKV